MILFHFGKKGNIIKKGGIILLSAYTKNAVQFFVAQRFSFSNNIAQNRQACFMSAAFSLILFPAASGGLPVLPERPCGTG